MMGVSSSSAPFFTLAKFREAIKRGRRAAPVLLAAECPSPSSQANTMTQFYAQRYGEGGEKEEGGNYANMCTHSGVVVALQSPESVGLSWLLCKPRRRQEPIPKSEIIPKANRLCLCVWEQFGNRRS